MKNLNAFCFVILLGLSAWAQDYQIKLQPKKGPSYSYEKYPFPKDIMVFDMNKKSSTMTIDGLTLIQVWSTCCGAEPEVWSRIRSIEEHYRDRGLKTLSVNFENGSEFASQYSLLQKFFQDVEQPEHFYFDSMGYVIDLLEVPGFPTYFLVAPDGNVVFRTNGKDEEGVSLLESEIESRLKS